MFDQISIGVKNLERSRLFDDAAMATLGYDCLSYTEKMAGYGKDKPASGSPRWRGPCLQHRESGRHFCFTASSREAVDAFHANGIANGGEDNGPLGVRPEYATFYDAAFIIDPDGYRIKAFFHMPE